MNSPSMGCLVLSLHSSTRQYGSLARQVLVRGCPSRNICTVKHVSPSVDICTVKQVSSSVVPFTTSNCREGVCTRISRTKTLLGRERGKWTIKIDGYSDGHSTVEVKTIRTGFRATMQQFARHGQRDPTLPTAGRSRFS